MQISCFPNSYGRFGPQAALELLPQAGIKWMELPIKNTGVPSFFKETPLLTDASDDAEVERVQQLIDASELSLSSCNITSGNPLDPEVLQRTLTKIRIAGKFGVPLVVAGAGELNDQTDWPQLIQHLKQIGDLSAEHNIIYCCETHPGVSQNAASMLDLMDRLDHPHVQLNFDTGNLFYYNESPDLYAELRQVMPFVKHVHLKDTNGEFKDWHFPALGAGGAVDFVKIREILEESNFNGPCSLETEGIENEPEMTLDDHQNRIVQSMAHLKECGFKIA